MKCAESIHGGVTLKAANKIFVAGNLNLHEEFNSVMSRTFGSMSEQLDFSQSKQSAQSINSFVEEKTNKLVQDLIQPSDLDSLTRLVLVNAVYFKGDWKQPFDRGQTYSETFFSRNGVTIETEMMSITNKKFMLKNNPAGIRARTCELLYEEEKVAMTVILPDEGVHIEEIEAQLVTGNVLSGVLSQPEISKLVNVFIPKFKIEFRTEVYQSVINYQMLIIFLLIYDLNDFKLSDSIIKMRAPYAFDSTKADFSGMASEPGLFISKVVHKAVVDVNEEGTEAAAATGVVMMKRSLVMMEPPEDFRCNRPFLFVIHEKQSNGILFIGKYMKPIDQRKTEL